MRILLWHVHGSWTTSFVQGPHEYVVPLTPERDPDGRGRALTWEWPASVKEVPVHDLGDVHVDLVILQRPRDVDLLLAWTGRKAGVDVPAIYVEHNAPPEHPVYTVHPVAHRDDIPIVHVTHFNALYWDNGIAPTRVIEHGIIDPGYRWTGTLPNAAVVINEPVRRNRVTGSDLLAHFARVGPIDLFGDHTEGLHERFDLAPERVQAHEGLDQERLHDEMARRRVYLHTPRWTSMGLSLLEAMHLGMPIVAVAGTDAHRAVPPEAGVTSTSIADLQRGLQTFLRDWPAAQEAGLRARAWAIENFSLRAFISAWQSLLEERVT